MPVVEPDPQPAGLQRGAPPARAPAATGRRAAGSGAAEHARDQGEGELPGRDRQQRGGRRPARSPGRGVARDVDLDPHPAAAAPQQRLGHPDGLHPPVRDGLGAGVEQPVPQPQPVRRLRDGEAVLAEHPPDRRGRRSRARAAPGGREQPGQGRRAPRAGRPAGGDQHDEGDQRRRTRAATEVTSAPVGTATSTASSGVARRCVVGRRARGTAAGRAGRARPSSVEVGERRLGVAAARDLQAQLRQPPSTRAASERTRSTLCSRASGTRRLRRCSSPLSTCSSVAGEAVAGGPPRHRADDAAPATTTTATPTSSVRSDASRRPCCPTTRARRPARTARRAAAG